MQAKAVAKYVRISPLKAGRVADLIRGKKLGDALSILRLNGNKSARAIEKCVRSAAANAENNHDMNVAKLYVAEISANQGPTMKRMMPGSMGRGMIIKKRSTNISVVLKEKE